jgi:hypothetical protein
MDEEFINSARKILPYEPSSNEWVFFYEDVIRLMAKAIMEERDRGR